MTSSREIGARAAPLLTAERTALNFLQRLSGIATMTRKFVDAAGGRIIVLDTRKTTPTLRVLEKYAVRAGGGTNHRGALDDGVLIKDNHIRLAGGIEEAVERMRAADHEMVIEIEAQTVDEVDEALARRAPTASCRQLLDDEMRDVVRRTGRAKIEVSGGVTLDRMPALAGTGADFVSVGALTHSAPAADLSLELEPDAYLRRARRARMSEPLPRNSRRARGERGRRGAFGQPVVFQRRSGSTNDLAAGGPTRRAEGRRRRRRRADGRTRPSRRAWFSPPGAGPLHVVVIRRRPSRPGSRWRVAWRWPTVSAPRPGCRSRSSGRTTSSRGARPGRAVRWPGFSPKASSGPDGVQHVVLGIGINLRPPRFRRSWPRG